MTPTAKIRQDCSKQYKLVRKIMKQAGYLKPIKRKSERDLAIREGRF